MAIDQVLLESSSNDPIVRFYQWSRPSVSCGYFVAVAEVELAYPERNYDFVRRLTGGGMVDHRNDFTYSIIVPRGHALSEAKGDVSYELVHRAVSRALHSVGVENDMQSEDTGSGQGVCFDTPVTKDLVLADSGAKLAGAGQRRNKFGLLHQGSVLADGLDGNLFSSHLLDEFGNSRGDYQLSESQLELAKKLAAHRYSSAAWNLRR